MSAELRSDNSDQLFHPKTETFQGMDVAPVDQLEGAVDRTVAEIVAMSALIARGNRAGTNNGATEIGTLGGDRIIDTGQTD